MTESCCLLVAHLHSRALPRPPASSPLSTKQGLEGFYFQAFALARSASPQQRNNCLVSAAPPTLPPSASVAIIA